MAETQITPRQLKCKVEQHGVNISSTSTTSSTESDITGSTIQFTAPCDGKILVQYQLMLSNGTASNNDLAINVGGSNVTNHYMESETNYNMVMQYYGDVSAGTVTVKLRWKTTSSTTLSLAGSTGFRSNGSVLFIPD